MNNLPITSWKIAQDNTSIAELFIRELGIHPIISQILAARDFRDVKQAKLYLSPTLKDLHNPFLMKNMKEGVNRLIEAINQREKIIIYGDYDADGITSVAILYDFLRAITDRVTYYIPDRIDEGYGLNQMTINKMLAEGITLLITVDCGVSDNDEIAYALSLGIDTIILDHHEISANLPRAVAIINPKQTDCPFPFKHLAAVGIAFNFLIALRGILRQHGFWNNHNYPNLKDYLDIVALGTIADIVPLVDENRTFVRIGLELITSGSRIGLKALKEVCSLENHVIDTTRASFSLIPRINAAGRIASAKEAVELLMTKDMDQARGLARQLDFYNKKRQTIERMIFDEIISEVDNIISRKQLNSLVLASPKWHPGVIGIVASKLVDRYNRPAILISLKDGLGRGSGRSVADFNIYQGLKKCDSYLLSYGGHCYAAGISIMEDKIKDFSVRFDEIIKEDINSSHFMAQTSIDAHCLLTDIDHDFLVQLEQLAPFGQGNPEPVLCAKMVSITSATVVGNNHLKMKLVNAGRLCDSIWFGKGHFGKDLPGNAYNIVFTPQINYYNGTSGIQLKMRDLALS